MDREPQSRPARESLKRLLAATPRLPPARAARLGARMLVALGERQGQHGKLAPEVVLVGAADEVSLVERTAEAPVEYQSPEQALGEPVDGRSDLYAVGVMLYEMLAGRRPFEGKTRGELISALLVREAAPLGDLCSDGLAAVVKRALAKRPAERWQTAAEMREALEAAGGDEAPAAAPPAPSAEPAADDAREPTLTLVAGPPSTPPPAAVSARPPAAASARPAAAPARPRYPRASLAAGVAILVALAAWLVLRPARLAERRDPARPALQQAEAEAQTNPRDSGAWVALGGALFARGEKERALAAYREACRLDREVGKQPELLANLRATFSDPRHGEAAFKLAETIGPPAEPILSDLAAHTTEARLKRRAADAIGRISRGVPSP